MKWFGKKHAKNDADQRVINQLVKRGADLAQEREVQHFLYFENQADADAASCDISIATRWVSSVQAPSQDSPQWCVVAELPSIRVSVDEVKSWRTQLEIIAAEHSGDYDGWVASV